MPQHTLGIGLIGGGMIAIGHMKNFAADPRVRILWVADPSDKALANAKEQFAVPNLTKDYREMLKDPAVDAVVVCTPPALHTEQAIAVMRAKKHLMLEKPMAATIADVRKIVAEARKHPKLIITDCSARHARLNPKFSLVKKMIDSGKLGRVYFIHHNAIGRQGRGGIEYNPPAKWFLDRKLAGGGPLMDWGVYDLSFHLGILNEPKFLSAKCGFCINGLDKVDPGTKTFTVEEHGAVLLEFDGGLKYFWERGNNAHNRAPNETRIYGTKGGLRLAYCTWDSPEITYYWVDKNGRGKAKDKVIKVDMSKHKGDLTELDLAFVSALLGKGPIPMPLDLAARNMEIIHKAYACTGW